MRMRQPGWAARLDGLAPWIDAKSIARLPFAVLPGHQ
jgi:hypothetical protein